MRVISGSARGTVLHSIEDISTRPTLDRVKESLFNIIQNDIEDNTVLDLFAGSGAIGIEFLSRRAKQVYFCDKSSKAVAMIEKNLKKTKLKEKAIVYNKDYIDCINTVKNIKFDIIFLDPPYKEEFALDAIEKISNLQLLKDDGIIFADNILYKGYVMSDYNKHKQRTAVTHLRQYIKETTENPELNTKILDVGDGLAITKKVIK